ncbi:hypothetical protein Tco_0408096 [Tanacetum coccineum]
MVGQDIRPRNAKFHLVLQAKEVPEPKGDRVVMLLASDAVKRAITRTSAQTMETKAIVTKIRGIDLLLIELGSFDVIIGMDWMSEQHAKVVCHKKYIRVSYGNDVLIIQGERSRVRNESRLEVISSIRTQRYIEKGRGVFLIQVTKKEGAKIPEK